MVAIISRLEGLLNQIYGAKMSGIGAAIGGIGGAAIGSAWGMPFLGASLGSSLGGALGGSGGGFDWAAFNAQSNFNQNQFNASMADNWARQIAQQDFQRELAQQGIRYRVEDAARAGISPLVALGAPTFSPSVSVGGVSPTGAGQGAMTPGDNRGRDFAAAISDVARQLTDSDKAQAMMNFQREQMNNSLEVQKADIMLKGAQAAYWAKKTNEPSFPSVWPARGGLAGQGSVIDSAGGTIKMEPPKVENAQPSDASVAAGAGPDTIWKRSGEYTMTAVPRDAVTASASILNPEYLKWQANRVWGGPPPMEYLPPGTVRWVPSGINTWKATPYYPWEAIGRKALY